MDINELKMKANVKITGWKWKAKVKTQEIKKWCKENPESALVIGGGILGAAKYIGKAAIKRSNINKEEQIKTHYCYDRSLGHYWSLKRELTNREWLEIDKRKRDGEKMADILDSMKVLK